MIDSKRSRLVELAWPAVAPAVSARVMGDIAIAKGTPGTGLMPYAIPFGGF